jgi:hypothetical protein
MKKPRSVPHVAGSATSAAASKEYGSRARDEKLVLDFIQLRGVTGATDEEISESLTMNMNTVRPRRVELRDQAIICDSGDQRPTKSGRMATVWIAGRDGGNPFAAPARRVLNPGPKVLWKAMQNLREIVRHSRSSGGPADGDDLRTMALWVQWIARKGKPKS